MFFRQFYDERLAQASYLIGSTESKQALVVDPRRDVDIYAETAGEQDLHIVAVTETHIHADFLSGSRELAHAAGAALYLSGEGQSEQGYLPADADSIRWLKDGDSISLGELRIRAIHTPGHTPEHLSFAVFDGPDKGQPMLLLTGDCMFVGDLGRPDLLEEALGQSGSAQVGAGQMFSSVRKLLAEFPDFVQVWPGHGAGSACGRALSAVPSTSLGYERRFAWWSELLARGQEAAFVDALLRGQPDAPTYFANMKRLNRGSMRLLRELPRPGRLDAATVRKNLAQGATLVDTRPREAFVQSHARGAIHVADGAAFSNWSAWFVPSDASVILIAKPERVDQLVRGLVHVGIDNIIGYIPEAAALELPQVPLPQLDANQAAMHMAQRHAAALDVRSNAEYNEEHIPGALHVSAGRLLGEAERLPKDRPLIVCCSQGERSVAASSVLLARGFDNVLNLSGGLNSWRAANYPVAG